MLLMRACGVRAAENLAVAHAGDVHVGKILSPAGYFGFIINGEMFFRYR